MAIFEILPDNGSTSLIDPIEPATLWRHYVDAGLIYDEKLHEITPLLADILTGWPRLFAAPDEVFSLNIVRRSDSLSSSLCRVRDSDQLMLLQHAASQNDPIGQLACILAAVRWYLEADRPASALGFFYRPENVWPSRIARIISASLPAHCSSLTHRALLTARPPLIHLQERAVNRRLSAILDWDAGLVAAVTGVVASTFGPLRAYAAGFDEAAISLPQCQALFAAAGLCRERRIHVAWRDGSAAGVALRYVGDATSSLSLLDQRVEIIVRPDAPNRAGVVRELAEVVIADARLTRTTVLALVIDPIDEQAAASGGFRSTGRSYSDVVWDYRSLDDVHRAIQALTGIYDRVTAIAHRRGITASARDGDRAAPIAVDFGQPS